LRAVLFFLIIFFSLAVPAAAQNSPQIRRLPPSLERELKLKHGGKVRIIGFVDTVKAQNIIAQSIRDSTVAELDSATTRDTAIIVVDSAVSLTDKEWLDSMLAQLPEYQKTPDGIRFHYPSDILIETNRKVVPPDTTLASRMDPVTKEDLPLYTELPMPRPLRQLSLPRTSVELGAGTPYLPRLEAHSLVLSNESTAVELDGKFFTTSADEPAIKQYWNFGATGKFAFPTEQYPSSEQVPELDLGAHTGANKRSLIGTESILSVTDINAGFTIGSPSQLKLRTSASLSFLNNDLATGTTETSSRIAVALRKDYGHTAVEIGARYEAAFDSSQSLAEAKAVVRTLDNSPFKWKLGVIYLAKGSVLSAVGGIQAHLSPSIEIGASFEPENKLMLFHDLTGENLFYAPSRDVHDGRMIVTEPVHLNIFANYFHSVDNEIHVGFHLIQRNNEPVFFASGDSGVHTVFTTKALRTQRIELEAGGSIRISGSDKLSASIILRSVSDRDSSITLPFIPTAELQAAYQFGISEKFIPQVELEHLERPNHTFTFINLGAQYIFSPQFQLKLRAENIFGSAGDFWQGYDEYPRSVWLSAKYLF
jgi:hypothetical protein